MSDAELLRAKADQAKCPGRVLLTPCPARQTCERYLRPEAERQVWHLPLLIDLGEHCTHRIPVETR